MAAQLLLTHGDRDTLSRDKDCPPSGGGTDALKCRTGLARGGGLSAMHAVENSYEESPKCLSFAELLGSPSQGSPARHCKKTKKPHGHLLSSKPA